MHKTFFKEGKKKKKPKGKVAKFSKETKIKIFERDGGCILCGKSTGILDYHHVLYGLEKEITDDRNDVNKGVCIHREPHQNKCHGSKVGEGVRQFCIDYLENLGKKIV